MKNILFLLMLVFVINLNAQDLVTTQFNADMNAILQTYINKYTEKSSEYADCVLWCAMQCASQNDNKQALSLLESSDHIFKNYGSGIFCGRDTIAEILRYDILSKIEQNLERNFYAIKHAKRSLKLKRLYFGEKSEQVLNALLDLAQLYAERHHYRKAADIHNIGYNNYVELLKNEFCSSSESKRNRYWKVASLYVGKTLTEALKYTGIRHTATATMTSAAYNAILLSKGILLNTTIDFVNYVKNSNIAEAIELLDERRVESDIASQDSLDYLILNVLKKEGKDYNIPQLSILWQDIANKINDDDVVIEFFRTPLKEYGALVIKKEWKTPKIIKMKNHVKIGNKYLSLENAIRLVIDNNNNDLENSVLFQWNLSKAIWTDELLLHFPREEGAKVFFSADGLLQLLNMESLPFNNQQGSETVCMSDIYNLYRLSSTRMLVIKHNESDEDGMATLYGNILYDVEDSIMMYESAKYPVRTTQVRYIRGAINDIEPLVYTKNEIDSIVSTLERVKPFRVASLTQSNANEESFKNLSGTKQRILHLATHGYYTPMDLSEIDVSNTQYLIDSSMLRTGLLLSGAQRALMNDSIPNNVEDGILTAYEIAHVDLTNLDIAVLSACQTALGDVSTDGVAGLQRGFKQAGAKSILMSLWKVDDEATCVLMTEFYRNWIAEGKTKHDALEAAKQTVRSYKEKGWDDPKYWAAFILLDALD